MPKNFSSYSTKKKKKELETGKLGLRLGCSVYHFCDPFCIPSTHLNRWGCAVYLRALGEGQMS